jgi:hypothetical protein
VAKYDFDGTVPKGFVLAKPIEHTVYDQSLIYDLEKNRQLMITHKRNGWKMFLEVNAAGKIRFLTDGLNEIDTWKVSHLIVEAEKLELPPRTLLVGEVISNTANDDRGVVISVMQCKNRDKFKGNIPELNLALFNIVFWEGYVTDNYDTNYKKLLTLLYGSSSPIWGKDLSKRAINLVSLYPLSAYSFDEMKKYAVRSNWEGLVLYDTNYKLTYRLDGKAPERPRGCYKWKPEADADLIALGCRMRDNDPNTVKDLKLYQIDPKTGDYIRCLHYGTFKKIDREAFSKLPMRKIVSKRGKKVVTGWFEKPFVCQLTYDARSVKTGKLEGARNFLLREDKRTEECIAPKSYPEAEYLDTAVLTAK